MISVATFSCFDDSTTPKLTPAVTPEAMRTNQKKAVIKQIIKKTPHIKELQNEILKLKLKNYNYTSRLRVALKLLQNKTFRECLKKHKNISALFTVAQYRKIMKEYIKRRTFSKEEKVKALRLYKRGTKAYKWLSKIFLLPSASALKRLVSKADIKPGFNVTIFEQLAQRAKKMTEKGMLCILLFDEIPTLPKKRQSKEKTDHALIFILQGIVHNYKLPLAYTFSKGQTSTEDLKLLIKNIVVKLDKCGFTVLATVCNHETRNINALNELALESQRDRDQSENYCNTNIFKVNGKEIAPIYDPANLMKGIRNNLMKMDMKTIGFLDDKVKTAKWEHLVNLCDNASSAGRKLIPQITKNHVHPNKIAKRNLRIAIQILSYRVAALLHFESRFSKIPKPDRTETAEVVHFYDRLFDSMNGNLIEAKEKQDQQKLLGRVSKESKHNEFWMKAKNILKSTKFITKEGKEGTVPTVTCWLRTLEHIEFLQWNLYRQYGVEKFWTRRFSLHAMEEFLSSICSHGYKKIYPTQSRFEEEFASLLYNGHFNKLKPNDWTVPRRNDDDNNYLCSVM